MTPEQKAKFTRIAHDPKVEFIFIPSADLKQRVVMASDPILNNMATWMKTAILMCEKEKAISLDPSLVIKYIENTLDNSNSYLLRLGEIRVLGYPNIILKNDNSNS